MRARYHSCSVALVLVTFSACHLQSRTAEAGTAGIVQYSFLQQGWIERINALRSKRFDHDDAITSPVTKRVAQLVEGKSAAIPRPSFEPARGRPNAVQRDTPPVQPRPADIVSPSDLDRAEALINLGDLSGARLLLSRPADLGNARALLLLARTYDPKYLPGKRYGIQSDEAKASELYRRATAASTQPETAHPPSLPAKAEAALSRQPDAAITDTENGAVQPVELKVPTEVVRSEQDAAAAPKDLVDDKLIGSNDAKLPAGDEGSFRDEPAGFLPAGNTSGLVRNSTPAEAISQPDLREETRTLEANPPPLAPPLARSGATAVLDLPREGGAQNDRQRDQKQGSVVSTRVGKALPKLSFPNGPEIFSLLWATNRPASEPQTMPSEVVALEPMLGNFRYLKRPDGEIALVGLFANAIFGILNRENVPLPANRSSGILRDESRR
jgi:hypothetical protein